MPVAPIYIVSAMLFIGVAPLPYGYYMLLRFVACGIFVWAAYISFERNENVLSWIFILLAIVFNPIIKIHFPKEMWAVIDFCSGLFLVLMRNKIQANGK
jgi:hypothetical protein